jgi:hypothetical protein
MEDSSEELLQPLNTITDMITDLYVTLQSAIDGIRGATAKLRKRLTDVVVQIMGKVLGVVTPIQVMFATFSDIMQKTQGVMAASLFTILGIFNTLQAGMGAAVEGIIKILIVMVGVIAALWIMPFTMPAAAISTAIFLTISIPVAIITAIVSKALKIKSSGVPGLCFDEDTLIKMGDGTWTKIKDVELGRVLGTCETGLIHTGSGTTVTGAMRLTRRNEKMYELNGITVSGSHVVEFCDKWIKVSDHPYANLLASYNKPYLYCLNTSSKTITIDGTKFTDWDELYGEALNAVLKLSPLVFEKIDGGFASNSLVELRDGTMISMKDVVPDAVLKNGATVLGTVKVKLSSKNRVFNYCLGDSVVFTGANINVLNDNRGTIVKKREINKVKEETMYHLITDTGEFVVSNIKVYDYNSLVDKYSKQMGCKFQIMG